MRCLVMPLLATALLSSSTLVNANEPCRKPAIENWKQIAEGVFETWDACGARHLRIQGESGVRWKIAELEGRLDEIRDHSGRIPLDKNDIASSIHI